MKYQGIVLSFLLAVVLFGTTAPAKAVEAPSNAAVQASALGVSSYKGNALTAGERSMVVISPYGTSVTAVSSNPDVIALEQVSGYHVMVAKASGTAVISVTDEAGRTANMTITVSGGPSATPKANVDRLMGYDKSEVGKDAKLHEEH